MHKYQQKTQGYEVALVFSAVLVLISIVSSWTWVSYLTLLTLIFAAVYSRPFSYVATYWFRFAEFLGHYVSIFILSFVFAIILTPLALLFRITNKNPLYIKDPGTSVFFDKELTYSSGDFKLPF